MFYTDVTEMIRDVDLEPNLEAGPGPRPRPNIKLQIKTNKHDEDVWLQQMRKNRKTTTQLNKELLQTQSRLVRSGLV